MKLQLPREIREAIEADATLVLSLSGGKDSQAMASAVVRYVRSRGLSNRMVAVHADLGRAEWHQTHEVVAAQAASLGLELTIVQRDVGNRGPEDLLDHITARAEKVGREKVFWPSSAARYCTSDLKRDPINKFLRTFDGIVISVEGLRAEESAARAKKGCWEPRKKISTATRTALTWRPIHDWSEADVWAELGGRHGDLVHPAYALGNERLSCSLCVLASKGDLVRGATHNPEYANAIADLEVEYGYTFTETTSILQLCIELGIREEN